MQNELGKNFKIDDCVVIIDAKHKYYRKIGKIYRIDKENVIVSIKIPLSIERLIIRKVQVNFSQIRKAKPTEQEECENDLVNVECTKVV